MHVFASRSIFQQIPRSLVSRRDIPIALDGIMRAVPRFADAIFWYDEGNRLLGDIERTHSQSY